MDLKNGWLTAYGWNVPEFIFCDLPVIREPGGMNLYTPLGEKQP